MRSLRRHQSRAKRLCWKLLQTRVPILLILSLSMSSSMTLQAAHAQMSPEMKEGIIAYKSGQYKSAVTSLMGALNTEFNNATLHYYLGNSFVHLKQNESAIREFRIAYALAPDQEVGKFSKEALTNLGIDVSAGAAPAPYVPPKPVHRPDPIIAEALESLRKQSLEAQRYENQAADFLNRDSEQRHQRELERQRNEMVQNNGYWRRGRFIPNDKLSNDSQQKLDGLKSNFDNQINTRKNSNAYKVNELRRTEENLERLINEKNPSRSGVKIKPAGTNLYTRNYENPNQSK
jgi:tetratricopeptide (TPR) repeat protein